MTKAKLTSHYLRVRSSKSGAKSRYKSDVLRAVHVLARDLHDAGVMDKQTMDRFDATCLTPVKPLSPRQIAGIRRKSAVSQAVFAYHLNVSHNLISQWERGEKKPSGSALKLLTLIDKKGLDWVA